MKRPCAVAGSFYPADAAALRKEVERLMPAGKGRPVFGAVAPHAGYVYSGATAGLTFAAVDVPGTVVVLGPNHTGRGPAISVYPGGTWSTPAGEIGIDEDLGRKLRAKNPAAKEDTEAHEEEHSIEVEVPFLLGRNPAVRLVAVVIGTQDLASLQSLGAALADAVAGTGALVVASSDMNHFEDDATTRAKDKLALDRLLAMDGPGLHLVCRSKGISMCGLGPAVAMLECARRLGATRAELVDYRTSADSGGGRKRCVGYAGVLVS